MDALVTTERFVDVNGTRSHDLSITCTDLHEHIRLERHGMPAKANVTARQAAEASSMETTMDRWCMHRLAVQGLFGQNQEADRAAIDRHDERF